VKTLDSAPREHLSSIRSSDNVCQSLLYLRTRSLSAAVFVSCRKLLVGAVVVLENNANRRGNTRFAIDKGSLAESTGALSEDIPRES